MCMSAREEPADQSLHSRGGTQFYDYCLPGSVHRRKIRRNLCGNGAINTLDYMLYRNMQQKIIDVLDTADRVHIKGCNGNRTDLYVKIHPLSDPAKETAFENCVADVNIPVGEVFTSPVLQKTEGKLHAHRSIWGNSFSRIWNWI